MLNVWEKLSNNYVHVYIAENLVEIDKYGRFNCICVRIAEVCNNLMNISGSVIVVGIAIIWGLLSDTGD